MSNLDSKGARLLFKSSTCKSTRAAKRNLVTKVTQVSPGHDSSNGSEACKTSFHGRGSNTPSYTQKLATGYTSVMISTSCHPLPGCRANARLFIEKQEAAPDGSTGELSASTDLYWKIFERRNKIHFAAELVIIHLTNAKQNKGWTSKFLQTPPFTFYSYLAALTTKKKSYLLTRLG